MKPSTRIILFITLLSFAISISASQLWHYDKDGNVINYQQVSTVMHYNILGTNGTLQNSNTIVTNEQGDTIQFTNGILFKLKDSNNVERLLEDLNLEYNSITCYLSNIFYLTFNDSTDVFAISRVLFESGYVEYSAPNFKRNYYTKNDTSYQWYITNPNGVDLNIQEAWRYTRGNSNVVIAILDTGVDLNHIALRNNLLTGYDAFEQNMNGACNNNMLNNHGTLCTGTIIANSNNICGIAPQCTVLPIRMLIKVNESYSQSSDEVIIRALDYAVNHGASVISCSWGKPNSSQIVEEAFENACVLGRNGAGMPIVCASGNDTNVDFPARLSSTIAVGAINSNGCIPLGYSSGETLDLVAPGVAIYTTDINGGYDTVTGTSYSCPMVAGIIGLMLSENPGLTLDDIKRNLFQTCSKLEDYDSNYYLHPNYPYGTRCDETGYGLANAGEAVKRGRIQLQCPPYISESSDTIKLINVPDGTIIDWRFTRGANRLNTTDTVIVVSNEALTSQSSYNSTVTATLHFINGQTKTISEDIYFLYSGPQNDCSSLQGQFNQFEGLCYLDPVPYGAYDFVWSIDDGWEMYSYNETATFTNRNFSDRFVTVTVDYRDASGQRSSMSRTFEIEGSDDYFFSVTPNPSSDVLNININNISLPNHQIPEIQEVQIYNRMGGLEKREQFNEAENSVTIDVTSLNRGEHVVRVYDGTNWHHKKIKIN